jgi:hypothetical protein
VRTAAGLASSLQFQARILIAVGEAFQSPPFLVKSRIDVEMFETIFFLSFLAALKVALAGAFSKEPRLKTGGVEGGESGGTSISLTKPGPFFVFDSKAVMFCLFLDNC